VNDSPANFHEKKTTNNVIKSCHPQNKAETQFTAFSPIFQILANPGTVATDQKHLPTQPKPTQSSLKREITTPTNSKNTPINAQQETKSSDSYQKAAHQNEVLPARISAPNQFPPR